MYAFYTVMSYAIFGVIKKRGLLKNMPRTLCFIYLNGMNCSTFFLLLISAFFIFYLFLSHYFYCKVMGNSLSKKKKLNKKKKSSRPITPRIDINGQENEHSTNTARSINSILVTSSNHRKNQPTNTSNSGLSQLNPNYPTNNEDTIQVDPFKGKVEHPQQHKLLAQSDFWPPKNNGQQSLDVIENDNNQLTVSSVNQLTTHSINSIQGGLQIDDYIRRLLDAGYASKVPKQLCLKNAEVTLICRTAMEIFLSQPVSRLFEE